MTSVSLTKDVLNKRKKTIGNRLKEERLRLKLSKNAFAHMLNVLPQNYGKYENGLISPGVEVIDRVSKLLNIPIYKLTFPDHIMECLLNEEELAKVSNGYDIAPHAASSKNFGYSRRTIDRICCSYHQEGKDCSMCPFAIRYVDEGICLFDRCTPDTFKINNTPKEVLPVKTIVENKSEKEQSVVHTTDNVNHPSHYTSGCGFECIDMMKMILSDDEFEGFCIGNAIKYIWRHKDKGGTEDLLKAKWYLETLSKDNSRSMVKDIYTLLWCKVNDLLEETE